MLYAIAMGQIKTYTYNNPAVARCLLIASILQ